MPIHFFEEDISFRIEHPRKTALWINKVIEKEKKDLGVVNYIFCSDEYLYSINKEYLRHNTYTDIITFDNKDENTAGISGDIFISIDRVRENAQNLKVDFNSELHRVLIHGILHLLGYNDKNSRQKTRMRNKENAYLSLR